MTDTVADVVRVIFEAGGHNEVARAFDSVAAKMARFEKSTSQSAASGVRDRVRGAQQESKAREAAMAALAKEAARWEADASKSADKAAKAKVKSDADANRARLREETELARQKARILDNSARYAGRVAEQQAAAEIRQAERVGRERVRIAERAARDVSERNKRFAGGATGIVGGATSRVLGGVGMLGGAALAIGGGLSFADSIRSELKAEQAATQLANAIYVPGASARGNKADLLTQAKLIQTETHIGKAESLAAAQSYIDLASDPKMFERDAKTGRSGFQELAKIAKAEGADVGEVFAAAGDLRVQNESLSQEGVLDMVRGMVGAGKKGAISMREMAAVAGKVTATSVAYQGDQTTSQNRLLGLAQLARRVTSSDEVGTVVSRFTSDVLDHQKELKSKYGINVADEKGRLIAPSEILSQMIGKSGGNLQTLKEMGLNKEGIRMAEAALTLGNDPAKVKAGIESFEKAGYSKADINTDFDKVMEDRAEKIDAAMIRLKEILADKGVPILDKFVTALEGNMPQIEAGIGTAAKWFEWFAEHPAEGIGALILANVAKDLAGAGIGAAVKAIITSLLTEGSAGNTVAGALNTGGAGKGAGLPGLAGAAAITLGMFMSTASSGEEGEKAGKQESQSAIAQLHDAESQLKSGKMSKGDADKKRREVMAFLSQQRDNADTAHQALDLASVPLSIVSEDARKNIAQTHAADEVVKAAPEIEAALKSLTKALEGAAASAKADGTGAGMSSPTNPSRTTTNAVPRTAQ